MESVCVIGAGNWGTTIAIVIANTHREQKITLWCYEEEINGRKLTEIINSSHENPKYLPGTTLPPNIFATADVNHVSECDVAVFVLPHQFLKSVCAKLTLKKGVVAVSLTKGFVDDDCTLASDFISSHFGINCSVLMGANIASEVAKKELAESTLACAANYDTLRRIFECDYFRVRHHENVKGAELCGALKNIVAVAYGVACGLGCGENTKAALLRVGIGEMRGLLQQRGLSDDVLFESCGVPDLIVTCMAGRNKKCGEQLARGEAIDNLLQGPGTAACLYKYTKKKGVDGSFKLFTSVYRICFEKADPKIIFECI
jgi:glycerol-3-phosphate dehydrogenase (NAD+)